MPAIWIFWLLPVSFLLHDLEEILTMEQWIRANQGTLESIIQRGGIFARLKGMLSIDTRQFTAAVLFELIIFIAVALFATLRPEVSAARWLFAWALGGLFLHLFVHAGQGLILRRYVPGLWSGLLITLPACVLMYGLFFRMGWLDGQTAWIAAGLGLVSFLPLVAAALSLGRLIFPARRG